MTIKKERFVHPLTFDFNEEIWLKSKQKGIKLYAVEFPEEWRKLVNDCFEEYRVPYKSLNALVALFQPEIVFTSPPLSLNLPWIVSREKFDLTELKELFYSWFSEHHSRRENVSSVTMTWKEYDNEDPFQNIPSLISLIVEAKPINIKVKKKGKTIIDSEIKFYRVLNLEGQRRQELISWPPFYPDNTKQAYSYVIAFKVETDPSKKQSLLYLVSIRRWGNRETDEDEKLRLHGLKGRRKRTVVAIPGNIKEKPGPVIEIKIEYNRERKEIAWADDIDKLAATIQNMNVVNIPPVKKAIEPIFHNKKGDGFEFGLIDTSQDTTYLREKVKNGIFIKERVSIFNSLSEILSDYGIKPSAPMWITNTIKTEKYFPKLYTTTVGKSEEKLEEYLQKNPDYSEITNFVENLRVILLLPDDKRTKDNSDLIYQYGKKLLGKKHTCLAKIKLEDAIFSGRIKEPRKKDQFKEQLQELIKSINKNETTMVIYGIREQKYYDNNKFADDPRQNIRDIILRCGGIPKQISFDRPGKSNEEVDMNVGKIINVYLDCFRMMGYPRAGFKGYELKGKKFSTLAFTFYKPKKGKNRRYSDSCLISVHIDGHGKIRGAVNDSEMMPLSQLYTYISNNNQKIFKSINISSLVYKRIKKIHKTSENLIVYLEVQHFRNRRNIFSLSNSERKKQVLWFDKDGNDTLGPKDRGLRIFRINNTDEIPSFFDKDGRDPPGHKSGIASKTKLNNTHDFVYSIGKRSDTFRDSKAIVKSLEPKKPAWNPRPIEILACFIQEEDNFMEFAQLIHKSRLIPPVSDTEVKNPFCLYLAKKVKEEMNDLPGIPSEAPYQSNLDVFF